ncbi:MAG: hypothetical protein HDQ97_15940, partial [Lachnospiraceae bacterium]|nr:hypothetical protein [Lachnospiraceae bacterium]
KVLQNIIRNETLYSTVIIRLPAPRFVVFYNGTDPQPGRQILRLSDAFEKKMEKPELELTVSVYNINPGYNAELMKACRLLKEYAQYVEQVRKFARKTFFPEAVEQAVDYCIRNGILADFLSKNRAEAIAVSIFEYDEEKHLKSERELAYKNGEDAGIEKGIALGREEGEKRFSELLQILMKAERNDDLSRAISDQNYREQLYLENNL